MNNNTTYKDSSLGKIPSDWEVKRLGEIAEAKGGKRIPKGESLTNINTGFPYIRVTDMYMGGVNSSKIMYIPKHIEPLIRNYKIKKNELFITVAGTIGIVGEIPIELDNANLTENANKIIVKHADKKYILFFLMYDKTQTAIKSTTTNNAQPKLALDRIRDLNILLPPLPEQTRIAEVLSAWDKAISNVQATIEQVQLRNKWLMQELLTGKRRLKGFGGEWKRIHIHEVAKEVSIRNKTDKQLTVLSCTKYDGLVDSLRYWGRQIFSEDISTYKIVPKNHFAYATNHIEEGSIGYQSTLDEALISPMYTVFKTDKTVNDEYFFKLLKSHRLIYEYNARMEGSIDRRGGLRWDAFSILKINLPTYDEQTAINQVLKAADKEVQVLKSKLEKLKEQKKGLMQVLLTGKKRLKI